MRGVCVCVRVCVQHENSHGMLIPMVNVASLDLVFCKITKNQNYVLNHMFLVS